MGKAMMNEPDATLLERYARQGDEAAFRVLVERYAGLVFRAALRQTDSAALAEEAAQNTFALLARRAAALRCAEHMAGWLHQAACLMARHLMRGERRRAAREQAAAALADTASSDHAKWDAVQDVLDDTMQKLPAAEREALLLRYFRGLSLREVGACLHTSEDAARMRIARAQERLRGLMARRGITSTAAALSGAFASCAAAAALPADLAARTASAALKLSAAPAALLTTTAAMTAKTKITFAAAGALLACAVSIPVGMARERTLRSRIAEMQQQLDQANPRTAPARALAGNNTAPAPSTPEAPPQTAALTKPTANNNALHGMLLKAASGLANMPGVHSLLAEQSRPIMESRYAELLDEHWRLAPEQRAKVMDILCADVAEMALGALNLMEGGVTAEESKEISTSKKWSNEKRDARLAEALGDAARMEEFHRYEKSTVERERLRTLRDQLTTASAPLLSAEEEARLMDIMYTRRMAARAEAGVLDPDNTIASPEDSATFPARRAALDENILKEAAAFLSPAQTAALATSLTTMREKDAAGIGLAAGILNPPASAAAPALRPGDGAFTPTGAAPIESRDAPAGLSQRLP